jgi:hypothetical protein
MIILFILLGFRAGGFLLAQPCFGPLLPEVLLPFLVAVLTELIVLPQSLDQPAAAQAIHLLHGRLAVGVYEDYPAREDAGVEEWHFYYLAAGVFIPCIPSFRPCFCKSNRISCRTHMAVC